MAVTPTRLPPDLPDEPAAPPVFTTRRKAEALPSLRPPVRSKEFDRWADLGWCRALARADWQAGFRWGIAATAGGLCLVLRLAVLVAP